MLDHFLYRALRSIWMALKLWAYPPMTPEERAELDEDIRTW